MMLLVTIVLMMLVSTRANDDDEELMRLIDEASSEALFSGYVAGVTILDCKRDTRARIDLLRRLSAKNIYSSVLDLEETFDRIPQIAWFDIFIV